MMTKLLLGTALALCLSLPAHAAVIADLGVNPTSAQGDFNNAPGGGLFADQYTFQLVGGPQFITIASATNTFASLSDFIANFQATVYQQVGAVGGGDDIIAFGPQSASGCSVSGCQLVAGSGVLDPGNYYLDLTGLAGGTAGYGGNLSVAAVPGPIVGAGIPGLIAGCFGLFGLIRLRRRLV
jgi:hypothetical protein